MSADTALDPVALNASATAREAAVEPASEPGPARWGAFVDRLGAVLGFACAIHCVVVPLALGVLPALGLGFLADEGVDLTIVSVASVCAFVAARIGWRAHRDPRILLGFAASVALLMCAHAIGEHAPVARAISAAGGVGLAVTHLLNTRRSRACRLPGHAH